jgi:hypothetical protein
MSHSIFEDDHFKKLKPATKCLYDMFCKHQNRYGGQDGWFWRTEDKFASDTNLSKSTIKSSKKMLLASHFIECRRNGNRSETQRSPNDYRVLKYQEVLERRRAAANLNSDRQNTPEKALGSDPCSGVNTDPFIKNNNKNDIKSQ